MNKSVSVIIPIYNSEKYLKKTLDSILNQTFKDLEVICINDCSTDNSPEILKEYSSNDKKIKLMNLHQNIGAARSRNIGIESAKGKYIYFLDSDDYIDKNYLECMVDKLERENCDIALNLSILNEINGSSLPYKHPSMPVINPDGEFIDSVTAIHEAPCFIWARMYRKSFLQEHNLRFIDTQADDVVFNTITNIYCEKTFIFYGGSYHYTVNETGMTGKMELDNTKDINHIKAHSIIYDYLMEHNMLNNNLKLFRVYPFLKVDTVKKFDYYKKFFKNIENDFHKNENIYNEIEKFFAYCILNSSNYEEYLKNYNKIVTMAFLRRKRV